MVARERRGQSQCADTRATTKWMDSAFSTMRLQRGTPRLDVNPIASIRQRGFDGFGRRNDTESCRTGGRWWQLLMRTMASR